MDLILHNGNIITMDANNPNASAVAALGGKIKAVGSSGDILALKNGNTEIVDLGGKTVIPGFNDAHVHFLGYAIELGMVDLSGAKSTGDIVARFKSFIKENNIPAGKPVLGVGWNQNFFEGDKKNPTRHDLDKASQDHPIVASRACHHVCCVNSAALRHWRIDKNTPEVSGGEIERDFSSGDPTGILKEAARKLMKPGETLDAAAVEGILLKAAPNWAKMGITSIHSDDFNSANASFNTVYDAYVNMAKTGRARVRVNQQCRAAGLEDYKKILNLPQTAADVAPYFKLGPVKILADGTLGARTAFMNEGYLDEPENCGIPIYGREEFEAIVELCHEADRPVAVHGIGDGIIRWCMDAIKKNQKKNPKPHLRHGIIHCQITDRRLLEEFKENDVIAYIQPIFIHTDWPIVAERVGSALSSTSYAFKTLKNLGVCIPLSTDCPVEPIDPFKNIYCAVTRKDLNGQPENGYNPREALSVFEAVHAYTVEGAYASYEENVKGKIKAGMYADMAVLTKNIFDINLEKILETEVAMTVFDGKIIYRGAS